MHPELQNIEVVSSFSSSYMLLRFKQHLFCPLSKTWTGRIKKKQTIHPQFVLAQMPEQACVQGLGHFCIVFPEVAVASEKLLVKYPGTACINSSQIQSAGLVWYLFEGTVYITNKDTMKRHFIPTDPNFLKGIMECSST